ncbi:MAG: endonuclease III [Bacillota bacterium]|nr:endonuclease III [Bacillota bacterium]
MLLTDQEVKEVLDILDKTYPDARPELDHTNAFEMLLATILSAQCTDVRVNIITKDLFKLVKNPQDVLDLGFDRLSDLIRTCGFFNTKAKNILKTCRILVDQFDSQVPDNIEDLMTLPGVGRKTANVVVSTCFGQPAIAVDTHVFRVTNRIGLVDEDNVEDTEIRLMERIDRDFWTKAHHIFIFHGRRTCKARNPQCQQCTIRSYCKYYKEVIEK